MGALFTVVGLRGDDLAPSRKQTNGSPILSEPCKDVAAGEGGQPLWSAGL